MHMVVGNLIQGRSWTADIRTRSSSHQRYPAGHGPHWGRSQGLRAHTEPLWPGPVPLLRPRSKGMENPGLVRGYRIFTFTWRALRGHARRCAGVQSFVDVCRFMSSGLCRIWHVYVFRRVQLHMLSKGMKAQCLVRVGDWADQQQDVSIVEVNRKWTAHVEAVKTIWPVTGG